MSSLNKALELSTGPLSSISLDDEQASDYIYLPLYSLDIVVSITVNAVN